MKHIVFISFGKDSLAQLIEMKRQNMPIDDVVYVDIRYTKEISAEHPKMAAWIKQAEEIIKDKLGITVRHLTAKAGFKDFFYTVKQKGNHVGNIYGYPYIVGAWCNSRLKVDVIKKYIASLNDDVCEYVGIAFDEPKRYERLIAKNTKKITYRSILYEQEITEAAAFEICKKYDLVSPVYDGGGFRGGCWFCVKQSIPDVYELWKNYPDYFTELKKLEKDSFNTFKPNTTLEQLEARFIAGYVPKRRKVSGGGK